MVIAIRALRIVFGLIAVWQVIGLLPILTNWLPYLSLVTGEMWAIAFFKLLILVLSGGMYFGLGKARRRIDNSGTSTSNLRQNFFAILALLAVLIALALTFRTSANRDKEATNIAVDSEQPIENSGKNSSTQYVMPSLPTSERWTQESTGSSEIGPWLDYDPPGTRYYRDAEGIIFRVYPPGIGPDLEEANPIGLKKSTSRPTK